MTKQAVAYIEITVDDMIAAQRFYGAVFGFTFNAYGPGYAGIVVDGGEVGGLEVGASPKGAPVGPLVVLFCEDLDDVLAKVTTAGGTIVTPPYGFPGGRRFHFADPSGNQLAVWSEARS